MEKRLLIVGGVGLLIGIFAGLVIAVGVVNARNTSAIQLLGIRSVTSMSEDVASKSSMMDHSSMDHGGAESMQAAMDEMNATLAGKTGDSFDKAFLNEMIIHHKGAIDMAQSALTNAKNQEVKDLATAIIGAQSSEIAQMKAWQTQWGY